MSRKKIDPKEQYDNLCKYIAKDYFDGTLFKCSMESGFFFVRKNDNKKIIKIPNEVLWIIDGLESQMDGG